MALSFISLEIFCSTSSLVGGGGTGAMFFEVRLGSSTSRTAGPCIPILSSSLSVTIFDISSGMWPYCLAVFCYTTVHLVLFLLKSLWYLKQIFPLVLRNANRYTKEVFLLSVSFTSNRNAKSVCRLITKKSVYRFCISVSKKV